MQFVKMNKKKIYFIAWYFSSQVGGAEKSSLEVLKEYKKKGFDVQVICFDELSKPGKFKLEKIKGINYTLKYNFNFFSRYFTLWMNKKYMQNILLEKISELKKADFIIIQTISAPVIADFCFQNNLKYHYYLRDENNLNVFKNYEIGFRKYLKYLKELFDFPFKSYYIKSNVFALEKSNKIIANSKFIKNLLKEKFNLNSSVKYPQVDFKMFKDIKINKKEQIYITFIGGGNAMKGFDIIEKIAKEMPEENFLIVGGVKTEKYELNIHRIPNTKNILSIYKKTKILLMPSRCSEAFGRVVIEANYLNIPVISSNRGGLPEANNNQNNIIENIENIPLWCEKIKTITNKI